MTELMESGRRNGKNWFTGQIKDGHFVLTEYGKQQKRKIFSDAVFASFNRTRSQQIAWLHPAVKTWRHPLRLKIWYGIKAFFKNPYKAKLK